MRFLIRIDSGIHYFCSIVGNMINKLDVVPVEELNKLSKNTINEVLGIIITKVAPDFIEGQMPVDYRSHQAFGILHGGVSVVLAESLGSIGATLTVDRNKFRCYGMEVNANHIKSVRTGYVKGIAKPLHTGKSTQVWEIIIRNDNGDLVCICRLTLAIVPI